MGFKTFEEIEVWRKARALTNDLYKVTGNIKFLDDRALKNQLRRAGVSVMSNIAEGFERDGNKEFTQFLYIAKGSAGEIRSQLYVAVDLKYITDEEFTQLSNQAAEISRMLNGFIHYLSQSGIKGIKYKVEEE